MYKYGIQVALEALPERMPSILRGPIEDVTRIAAKTGYDAIELYIRDPKDKDTALLNKAAKDNGLTYCAICTGLEFIYNKLCITADDALIRTKATDRLKEHLDLGAAIGCPVVVGTMRGNLPDASCREEYLGRLGDCLGELDGYASALGGEVLVENIHQYTSNFLCTIPEVGAYMRKLALPNVKMHIDTHSMHIEDQRPYDALRQYADVLGYVHFSDSNRGYPGAGSIDFKTYYHVLMDIGYEGYITAECKPLPSEEECATLSLAYMKHVEQLALLERR